MSFFPRFETGAIWLDHVSATGETTGVCLHLFWPIEKGMGYGIGMLWLFMGGKTS